MTAKREKSEIGGNFLHARGWLSYSMESSTLGALGCAVASIKNVPRVPRV